MVQMILFYDKNCTVRMQLGSKKPSSIVGYAPLPTVYVPDFSLKTPVMA